jgi:two-component system, NarL family, response regulator NreC
MNGNRKCKVLVCDDHEDFRDLIKCALKSEPHIEIVGEASDGQEAVNKALKLRPDVVLMDLNMPRLTGLEATRRIKRAIKRINVLIVSMFDAEDFLPPCLEAGASGFVQKYHPLSELSQAIDAVRSGGTYMSPRAHLKVSRAGGKSFL